jgi:F0F1-type ATP synthase alpha subunit
VSILVSKVGFTNQIKAIKQIANKLESELSLFT